MVYKKTRHRVSEMVDDEPTVADGQSEQDFAYSNEKRGNFGKVAATLIVIVVVLVGGWYLLDRYTNLKLPNLSRSAVSSSDWQAVFLSNGQVYFGKIKKTAKNYLMLTDIYYLQVVTRPLQRTQEGQPEGSAQQPQQELTLIKLGNELHGPFDEMLINRDHILLTERLKEDSRVVQAINNYLQQQPAQ